MAEINYIDPDGNKGTYFPYAAWLYNDPQSVAQQIAETELIDLSELRDPDRWPREYKIQVKGEWVTVSVDMDYEPSFTATIKTN